MTEQKVKVSELESLLNPTTRKKLKGAFKYSSKNDLIRYILDYAILEKDEYDDEYADVYLHHEHKVIYLRYYFLGTNEWSISKEEDRIFLEISLNENYEIID